jgi:hypothetical protein
VTANGKVDRGALREKAGRALTRELTLPHTGGTK